MSHVAFAGRCFIEEIPRYTTDSKARTFGRKELEKLIKDSGYKNTDFYYPLPDYKF